MVEIKWKTDDAAHQAGIPEQELTGGYVTFVGKGVKVVRFSETYDNKSICLRLDSRPALAAHVANIEAAEKALKQRTVEIYLSSRGWGDYSPCQWWGDITRDEGEILRECRTLLGNNQDVDEPNQSDDQILAKIRNARKKWEDRGRREKERAEAEAEDIRIKIKNGFCFNCGSYCYGDCGNYRTDPFVQYQKKLQQAVREQIFGIND